MKKLLSIIAVTASVIAGSVVGVSLQDTTNIQAAVAPSSGELATARATILAQTNNARAAVGLPPVVENPALNTIAQNCSKTQANNFAMAHCPNFYNNYPAGWSYASENVASGQSYNTVVGAWVNSPGHYANIINYETTDLGIGYYFDDNGRTYFTQNFGAYRSTQTVPGSTTQISAEPAGAGSANVTWNKPVADGNNAVTTYQLEATSNGRPTVNQNVPSNGQNVQTYNLTNLQGGATYSIRVRAINGVGAGAWSQTATVTTVGTPSVNITNITTESTTATITFNVADNGSPTTGITVTASNKPTQNLAPGTTTATFTGLTPGTNTAGQITATNSAGTGTPVSYSFTTKAVAPDAPATTNAVVQDKTSLKVNWTDPGFNGGSALTGFTVRLYDASNGLVSEQTVSPKTHDYTFTNLTRGKNYRYDVSATNVVGSTTGTRGQILVPYTAPTNVQTVTAELTNEREITVSWKAPADNGGAEITTYAVAIYENGNVVKTVPVTNATSVVLNSDTIKASRNYSFSVVATNSASLNSQATFSNTVNVPAAPMAPSIVRDLKAYGVTSSGFVLGWNEPVTNGGSAISNYKFTILEDNGNVVKEGTTSSLSAFVTGLNPYTNYTYRVVAINRIGEGDVATGNQRTLANLPSTPAVTKTQPLGPTSVAVTVASANDGGDSNISYSVSLLKNGQVVDTKTSTGYTVFNNVELNTTYTIEVTATNSAGTSAKGTGTVTTAKASDAVRNLAVTPTVENLDVTWTAPASTGTYAITEYRVVVKTTDGTVVENRVVASDVTSTSFALNATSPIKYGTEYNVEVTPYTHSSKIPGKTATVATTTATTVPFAVTNLQGKVTQTDREATITWTAPANNGGATIQNYTVVLRDANNELVSKKTVTGTTAKFAGLSANQDYNVTVRAVNNVGNGVTAKVTFNSGAFAPAEPTVTAKHETGRVIAITITPNNDNGGSEITSYRYRVLNVADNTWTNWLTTSSATVKYTGAYGKTYRVEATTLNNVGTSPVATSADVTVPVIKPDAVTNVQISNLGHNRATVTWDNPTFDGGRALETSTVTVKNANDVTVFEKTVPAGTTNVDITGLVEYTNYKVTVTTSNGLFASNGTTADFRTAFAPAGTVQNVTFKLNTATSKTATLNWEAPQVVNPDAESFLRYNVTIKDVTAGTTVESNGLTVRFFSATNLIRGHVYEATVVATYGTPVTAGKPVTSEQINVATVAPRPVTDINVTWNGLTPTYTWKATTDDGGLEASYLVTVVNADGKVDTTTTTGLTFTGVELQPETKYTVSVTAFNTAGSAQAYSEDFETGSVPPSVPQNVKATADTTNRTITVDYEAPAKPGGGTLTYVFNLYTEAGNLVTTQNTPVFTGVNRGQTYYVTVTAANSAGSSPVATSNNVYVQPVAPSTPRNVTVGNSINGTTTVPVTWVTPASNGGATIQNYTVNVYNENGKVVKTVTVNGNVLTANVEGLAPNTTYNVDVTAKNSAGQTVSAKTPFTTPVVVPTAPRNVEAIVNQETATIKVTFDAVESNGGENVTYEAVIESNGKEKWTDTVTPEGFEVTVDRGQSYVVKIVATNSAGSSPVASSETVNVDAIAPTAPTNLTAEVGTNNTVTINWVAPEYNGGAEVTLYNYEILNGTEVVAEGQVDKNTAIVEGLAPNTTYSVRVTATNSAGTSPAVNAANLFTTNILPADFTTNITDVTRESFNYAVNVTSTGGVEENDITYVVTLVDANGNVVSESTTATGSFGGLTHATVYNLVVKATNAAGTTEKATEVKTSAIPAQAPTNVVATVGGTQTVNITWDAPSDNGGAEVTSYVVNYVNADGKVTGKVESNTTTATINDLPLGQVYTFTVQAVNEAGTSEASTVSNAVETAPAKAPTLLTEETFMNLINSGALTQFDVVLSADESTITVTLGEDANNNWFYGAAYSEPVGLGWSYTTNNTVSYDVSNLEAGNHNIAVYSAEGQLIGYAPFVITEEPPVDNGGNSNNGGNTAGNGNEKPSNTDGTKQTTRNAPEKAESDVTRTGDDYTWTLWAGGFALIAAGAIFLIGRRRKEENHI